MQRAEAASGGDALAQINQQRAVCCAVQQRHAVQHDGRGEHAKEEILDACFVALDVALAPCGKHVCGDGQKLECNEDGNKISRGRNHNHAQNAGEQQEVILATPVFVFFNVV